MEPWRDPVRVRGVSAIRSELPTSELRAQAVAAEDIAVVLADGASFEQEFVDFVRSAKDPLYRMAYLLSGDPYRAEELVQQTFERTWRSWRSARRGDPLAWSRRILANLRIDTWRRTRREVLTGMDPRIGVDGGEGTVDKRDAVVRALLTLPVKQRRVMVLRHLLDLSEAEVAVELGIPVGTVKSTASRALARLRETLNNAGGAR